MPLLTLPARRPGGRLALAFAAAVAVAFALLLAAAPQPAHAFGTVWGILGQHSEHERVTRLALQCGPGQQPPDCFQPVSLDNLAGKSGSFGAVGAPDDIPLHLNVGRDYWHCDNADWIDPSRHGLASYPQSRANALAALRECLAWGKDKLYDGGRGRWSLAPATPSTGAVAAAAQLIKRDGRVDSSNPGVGFFSPTCTFNGVESGRAKCNVLEPFGYVLHMAEDFYSHTNWVDLSAPGQPLSLGNPYGLGNTNVAPFLDLRSAPPADADIPANFTGGCYPKKGCAGRVIHGESSSDQGINKDKGLINTSTGVVTDPNTPRGAIVVDGVSNVQRAVNVAVLEARRQWEVYRAELAQRYGSDRAAKMICALVLDRSETCDKRNVVVAIDTSPPRRGAAAAARDAASPVEVAGRRIIRKLARTDRVAVVTFDDATGARDVDPFVAPGRARIDDANEGDAAPDPTLRPDGDPDPETDPTTTPTPDEPTPAPPPDGTYTHGSEPGGASASASRTAGSIAALRAAEALLANADAPRGQQGVVLVTNGVRAPRALVARIRALGARGAVVSVAVHGRTPVPARVARAVESTGGTVMSTSNHRELRRFAHVADASGLTRLDDPLPHHEATLATAHPVVQGVTDGGPDIHDVERLRRRAVVTVRALDKPLRVVVSDHASGKVQRMRARRGNPAVLRLRARGNYDVAVNGRAGRHYAISVDPRR